MAATAADVLYPAALVASLGNSPNRDSVRCVTHVQLLAPRQDRNREVGRGHLEVKLAQHFVLLPEVIHVALHLLKVAAGYSAGIGEEVGNQQNAALLYLRVGFGSG